MHINGFCNFDESITPEMKNNSLLFAIPVLLLLGCSASRKTTIKNSVATPAINKDATSQYIRSSVVLRKRVPDVEIRTHNVKPARLIDYARLQLGVPYVYGSMDKRKGFDCSGFINYVFNHFKIDVPRITYMFTNAGVDIPIEFSKPGDLILFTGSDVRSGEVGHMGIVTKNDNGNVEFIHASSSSGVIISGMNSYFRPRYVRVNRIFIPTLPGR